MCSVKIDDGRPGGADFLQPLEEAERPLSFLGDSVLVAGQGQAVSGVHSQEIGALNPLILCR